ncbi:uncharacterized protein Tco025E_05681 [Trypanosoma conorhini]|uniref:Uncharacterized protein n=1 Tax=Trypanosoma conorhini TaxID=83891 RepID=A0A422PB22_9TRYP|nr:uncharacterized protein Tco025E_05681 [Trypanosoma conorhini]RNF14925.1 hypothetical protein Tco025E_05681 [Trypanosoma conorhini]
MKLLKFVNCDAPNVTPDMLQLSVEEQRARVLSNGHSGGGRGEQATMSWHLISTAPSMEGAYWLLNDDNTPIGPIDTVLLAARDTANADCTRLPNGVEEGHIHEVDLRSKMGKQLQRARQEYGQTFKTAAKNAALLMDADRLRVGREEKARAERKRVVEAIENGEEPVRKTRAKREDGNKGSGSSKKR